MDSPQGCRRLFRDDPDDSPELPDGWTEDFSIDPPPGMNIDEFVERVLLARATGEPYESLLKDLSGRFGLCVEDVELAVDRIWGGSVRAQTTDPRNCPDRLKDPLAWLAYQKVRSKSA